jgi:hypothetical protein
VADTQDVQDGKDFHLGVPQACTVFPLKGSNSLDWGMKNRLARVFSPDAMRSRPVHGDDTPEKAMDLYQSLKPIEEGAQYAK